MTFHRFLPSFSLFPVAIFGVLIASLPAAAQSIGASRQASIGVSNAPARGLQRLTLSLVGNQLSSATPRSPPALRSVTVLRYVPETRYLTAPTPLAVSLPLRRLPTRGLPSGNLPLTSRWNAPGPIALGVYFYQNGQCAPGDDGAVSAWMARMGRLPAVWTIYQGWSGWNDFPIAQARRARQLGSQLMVTWEPWNGNANDSSWSCARIASGAQDNYIHRYAREVRTSGVPILIRLAHEMNGAWYPWATGFDANSRRHNGNSPQNYVAMWRHVVGIFRAEGASNVKWVWAPNIQVINAQNSSGSQNADLSALYPGDNYVDWIGLSVYNDTSKQCWRTFIDLFGDTYRTLTQLSAKPMMIAEMAATEAGAPYGTSKAAWISQTLLSDIPLLYPRVRLVNWFCRDKTNVGEANYRFDSSPGALQAFRFAANSPLYGGHLGGN